MSDEPNQARALAAADALAAHLVSLAAPVRFRVAASARERDASYRLRYLTVLEQGWAAADAFADAREYDDHDEGATHVLGWDGETLAATARLVFPAAGGRLPIESEFDVDVEPRAQVVDLGRGIVARAYRGAGHAVFLGLLASCWQQCRARGFFGLCGAVNDSMLALYRTLGFRFEVLGPARLYYGELRHPIKLDALGSLADVARHLAGEQGAAR